MANDSYTPAELVERAERYFRYTLEYCVEGNADKAEDCALTALQYFRSLVARIDKLPMYHKPKPTRRRKETP